MAEQTGLMGRAMDVMQRVIRGDSWRNTVTNVAVNSGKTAMRFTPTVADYLDDETLARLYELDGIAARVVDAIPATAMRHEPTYMVGDAATSAAVKAIVDDLGVWPAMQQAWSWGRCFGGAGVILGVDDGREVSLPLDTENIRALRFLVTADKRDLQPQAWHGDDQSKNYGTPATYRLLRNGGTTVSNAVVHSSRVIRFGGVPTTKRRRMEQQGWDDSVLQRVYVELQAARSAFAGAGTLIHEASVVTVGVKGLMNLMASDPTDMLKTRFEVMQRMFGIGRWLMHDADGETVSRLDVGALTGVVDVMDRFVNFLAAVSGIPVTVLMGQAPAGLNATGDSDLTNWYDLCEAERTRVLLPRLEQVVRIILRSKTGPTGGVEPEGWRIVMPPLRTPTPAERMDARAKQATTDVAYINAGVLTPEEVALSRFRPDGWSDETIVDLDAREHSLQSGGEGGGDLDHEEVTAILAKVAGREIPRDSGLSMLAGLGLTPERAESVMGETGRSFFTAPEPGHAAALADAQAQVAKLTRSRDGVRAMLSRVLERNKQGELVVGRLIAAAPTDTEEGDVLEEGDTVPAVEGDPAEALDGAAEARGDAVPEKYSHIDFTPPEGAQKAAARALEVRAEKPESQRGMTPVGIARARDLSNGSKLSPETVRRMKAYFDRHEGDKNGETWDEQGPGWQAWQGWGGDAGYAWARKVVGQMEAADRKEDA